ncbi:MAG: exosortase-associated EpsI family protein [Phycisphaerales bacterium]|nr:exosortase-associated EpsI family protein [Phycisphaerales bacterium]
MSTASRGLKSPAFIVAMTVMVLAAVGMSAGIRAMGIYLRKLPIYAPEGRELRALPTETENWIREGSDRIEEAETEATLGTKNYVTRVYVMKKPPEGKQRIAVELHCAYYTGMIDTVPHVPDRCFVGGGMQISQAADVIPIPLDSSRWTLDNFVPDDLKGRIYRARLGKFSNRPGSMVRLPRDAQDTRFMAGAYKTPSGQPITAGYFFIANGGTVARAEEVRLLAFDLKADYAYYLKVQFNTAGGETPEELARLAASLLDDLYGEIMRCVPDWVEVQQGMYPADNPRRPGTGEGRG